MLFYCGGFVAGAVVTVHALQIHVRYWRLQNQALKHDQAIREKENFRDRESERERERRIKK